MSEEVEVYIEDENVPADAAAAPEIDDDLEVGDEQEQEQQEEERVIFDERQQKFIESDILAPKVKRLRETERSLKDAQAQLEALRSQLPQDAAPPIPELPDPWADDYEEKLKARDAALLARAAHDRDQEVAQQQAQRQEQEQRQQFLTEFNKKVAGYSAQAKQLGISADELRIAGEAVKAHQLQDDLVVHLIEHDRGPAITVWLSEHVGVLDEISRMTPLKAATYIEKNVLPKVGKKRASAPPPTSGPRGSAGAGSDPLLKGAKFG